MTGAPALPLTSGLRIKSATSLRHGRIRQVLSVALPVVIPMVRCSAWRCLAVPALWISAYAGMTVRRVWNDGCSCPAPHLWIADQVRNDVTMRCIVL